MNNREELKKRVETSPRFIRICKGNRAPIIMEKENAFIDENYKSLGIKEIERRFNYLKKHKYCTLLPFGWGTNTISN